MAFEDYSATPSLNTTIAGQNIAPGGPPSAVGPGVRQLMADGKVLSASGGTFTRSGTGSVARPVTSALEDRFSLSDKGTIANALTALTSAGTDLILGGEILIPRGNWTLASTWTYAGNRLSLRGDSVGISSFVFNPASADVAIDLDSGGGGGQVLSSIRNLGFQSSNSVDKVAIRLYNVANVTIHDISISTGLWLGNSIGIQTYGRQKVEMTRLTFGCARPVVCSQNPVFPSLSVDHFQITDSELVGTSSSYPVIEFENGVSFASTTISGVAVVGGKDGILWTDTGGVVGAGFHLHLEDIRFEQGLDPTAYAIRLESASNNLQELLIENCRFGAERNGVYLRQCRRVTFINCTFNNTAKVALDITLVAGSTLKFINCTAVGTFTITNGRCISRSSDGRTLGFSEEWVYDAGTYSGALQTDAYIGSVPVTVADNTTAVLADDSFTGFVMISCDINVSAIYNLKGTTHTTAEVSDPDAFFTITKDTVAINIYWDAGSSRYVIQNKRGAGSIICSVLRLGTTI